MDLLAKCQELLRSTSLTQPEVIERMTAKGQPVSRAWLAGLKSNRFDDAGVRKIQALHTVLTEHADSGSAAA